MHETFLDGSLSLFYVCLRIFLFSLFLPHIRKTCFVIKYLFMMDYCFYNIEPIFLIILIQNISNGRNAIQDFFHMLITSYIILY